MHACFSEVFQSLFFWNSRPDFSSHEPFGSGFMFQSLFFWNSRPDWTDMDGPIISIQFQSLFFWNSRPDAEQELFSGGPVAVSILVFLELAPGQVLAALKQAIWSRFNPCFSGTRARTECEPPPHPEERGFQSLFFWNSRPDEGRYNDAVVSV